MSTLRRTVSPLAILNANNVGLESQGPTLSLAFAQQLAFQLPLPPQAAPNPEQYFSEKFGEFVAEQACRVNEECVVDLKSTIALTCKLWCFRHRLAFNPNSAEILQLIATLGTDVGLPAAGEVGAAVQEPQLLDSLAFSLKVGEVPTPSSQLNDGELAAS